MPPTQARSWITPGYLGEAILLSAAPMPHSKAVEIIKEGRGRHFAPDMVDAFQEIQEEFRQIAIEHADYEEEREALAQ